VVECTLNPPSPEPLALAFRGVSKTFGRQLVLDSLDLVVEPGSVVGLVGVNGSGKSTMIKCLLGLLKTDRGSVEVGGHDTWDLSSEIKARIGYVDQRAALYPWMKCKHLLSYVASFYPRWDDALIQRLADEWELPMDKSFGKLSPGQQQKVAVLAAIGHGPDLLVLDEPVSAMDPVARRAFLKALLGRIGELGCTVLLSTHITSDIERVASHVAILANGKIACYEELDDLKDRIKRLRIVSDAPLPPRFTVRGAVVTRQEAGVAVALSLQDPQSVVQELAARGGLSTAVEDLNLEEILLELSSGGQYV